MEQTHSITGWTLLIAEDYEIRQGILLPLGSSPRAKYYQPFEHPELSARLADIQDGDEVAALDFVRNWGLLGFSRLYLDEEGVGATLEHHGDPLDWLWGHAGTVRMLMNLTKLVRARDEPNLASYLRSIPTEGPQMMSYFSLLEVKQREITGVFGEDYVAPTILADTALMVSSIINGNCRDISSLLISGLSIQPSEKAHPTFNESFNSSALLPVVYHFIKQAALGRSDYYQCEYRHCRRWNPIDLDKDDRRGAKTIYCPPPLGSGASLCSRKERYERNK